MYFAFILLARLPLAKEETQVAYANRVFQRGSREFYFSKIKNITKKKKTILVN